MEQSRADAVREFYRTHPISKTQILDKLAARGVAREGLSEDVLQDHDQDHFGGVAANDLLARRAEIGADSHVLDICCGLGGPARYLAHNFGCRVTGIDLTQSRIDGAVELTRMTGLDHLIDFRCANALEMPFEGGSFDVAISQEAFCHVPDKPRLIAECARVLKPGGRLSFTDILLTERASPDTEARLEREMTYRDLATQKRYLEMMEHAGFTVARPDDLSAEWQRILVDRLAMYRSLREQTVARFGQAHFDRWDSAYSFFVGRYETGELGGARFLATRDD
jgi:sarcosine/dimethylglycine N-methyltransferase